MHTVTSPPPDTASWPAAFAAETLCEAFQITAAERAGEVAWRTPGGETEITWEEYASHVERIAAGLDALGVGHGDTVAMMLVNRPEFNLVDTGALHLGATPFSIYNTSSPEQIEYLFSNAENRVVVTERAFLPVIDEARRNIPALEHVVVVDGEVDGATTLEQLEAMERSGFSFESAWRAVEPSDVPTLIYTSGTTGPPKGVQLTHASLMAELRGMQERLPATAGGRATSYLPSAHIADRWSAHYHASIGLGCTVTSIPDPRTIAQHLPEIRPTIWGGVPRVWEKIKAALEAVGVTDPAAMPEEAKAAVRTKLGLDQTEWLIGGAAPCGAELLTYFAELGLDICELWGMSETSCCATCNPADRIKIGTVGPPIRGIELELADDGELLARGPLVMAGYRNDPERTAEALDDDGWLHTGDVATIDGDGYVTIVDRKKELIINAAGKNMSPANIESRLKSASPLIGQAIVIGDRRPYNVALLVLDPDGAAAFAREQGLGEAGVPQLAGDERVLSMVGAAVEEANSHLSRVEQIKRWKLLHEEWEPGGEELTPTMKLKRKPIAEKYAAEIETLYA